MEWSQSSCWNTDLTSRIFFQLQPNRHPALRVIREALREAPNGRGGDVWLCSGMSECPVQPASNGSKPTKQPQPSLSPPSPSLGQTDWCLLTDFSITRQPETATEGSDHPGAKLSKTNDSSRCDSVIVCALPHKLRRNLINVFLFCFVVFFLKNPVCIVFVTEAVGWWRLTVMRVCLCSST